MRSRPESAHRLARLAGLAAVLGWLAGAGALPAMAQTVDGLTAPPSMGTPAVEKSDAAESPLRVTLTQEASYKFEEPTHVVKNRSAVQLEYSRYFNQNFYAHFSGKLTGFLPGDHRHDAEGTDLSVPQAYLQTSFGQTSLKAGIQVLPWGESLLSPITDEVSPRDNRELFNFNLEELRVGQPMVVAERYSSQNRWSAFWIPRPAFDKVPAKGTEYFFDPFTYSGHTEGDNGGEVGASWRRNFSSADVTLMGASLVENDYALRMNADRTVTRVKNRFAMAGAVFNYAWKDFVFRGETAYKWNRAFNDAALQIVKRDTFDVYGSFDYRYSPTLTFSAEAVNLHVVGWTSDIQGVPRNRQSLLLSFTKLLLHDDLSITVQNFHNAPYSANLTMLVSTLKWDDHLSFGLDVVLPHTTDPRSGLYPVRDQKQVALKVQYQF